MTRPPYRPELSIEQLSALAKRRDLEARHTMRMAARLQSEADACRKEIRRRQREARRAELR
jgi:transposase